MAMKDIQSAHEKLLKIAAEARAVNGKDHPAAEADANKAIAAEQDAITATTEQDRTGGAPADLRETMERAIADLRTNEQKIASLASLSADLAEELAETRKQAARVEIAAGSAGKPVFTRELHETLIATPSAAPELVELRKTHDELVMLKALISHKAGRDSVLENLPKDVRNTRTYKKYEAQVRALYSTGSGLGDELIANVLSANVYEKFEAERKVAAFIPDFTMVKGEYTMPLQTTDPTVYLQAERSTDDGAAYKASDIATSSVSFAAKTLAALQYVSGEVDEDSISPIAPLWSRRVSKALAKAEENILINGDTSATHLDTGETVASDDQRRAWDGFRDRAAAITSTVTTNDLSSWATNANATFVGLVSDMADYSSDPSKLLCIPSGPVYWKIMVDNDRCVSAEKVGPFMVPTIFSGKLPFFFGMPVCMSGLIRTDLNASGIYDNSTKTKTLVIVVKPDAWLIGRRRAIRVESQYDARSGQIALVATVREIAKKMESATTGYTEAVGYNIAN